jgi:hypothetical protein
MVNRDRGLYQVHAGLAILPESTNDILWLGGWFCPRTGLDASDKRKVFAFAEKQTIVHRSSTW